MAGGAQVKISTWFSKPNQSLISKVTKKRVGFNLKIFVFALLKTVQNRAERNSGRILRLFNCNDRGFFISSGKSSHGWSEPQIKVRCFIQSRPSSRLLSAGSAGLRERWGLVEGSVYARLMYLTVTEQCYYERIFASIERIDILVQNLNAVFSTLYETVGSLSWVNYLNTRIPTV